MARSIFASEYYEADDDIGGDWPEDDYEGLEVGDDMTRVGDVNDSD